MIYCDGDEIGPADIDIRQGLSVSGAASGQDWNSGAGHDSSSKTEPGSVVPEGSGESLRDMEKETILRVLERCKGNRTKAAEELGISRRTIIYKLKRYGIE